MLSFQKFRMEVDEPSEDNQMTTFSNNSPFCKSLPLLINLIFQLIQTWSSRDHLTSEPWSVLVILIEKLQMS